MKKDRFALTVISAVILLAIPTGAAAGDAYFKGGLTFHPDLGGFSNRWLVAIGSDWAVQELAYVGVEFQGAYHNAAATGSASATSVPANVFVNGKWKSDAESIRPYAGAGLGMVSSIVRTEYFGVTNTRYAKDVGIQIMGGVEFNRKWVVELLGQSAVVDGAPFHWSVLGGIRW